MQKKIATLLSLVPALLFAQQEDSAIIRNLYTYHLTKSNTYENLRYLCKNIGGRISGSPQAEKAVEWAKQAMLKAGADTVYLIPCMVPHWVRGQKEKCEAFSNGKSEKFSVCALGGSVATPKQGVKAKVIEVFSFDELDKLNPEKVKGNIVFYNVSFDAALISPGTAYGKTVKYRSAGPSRAAKLGAVATIVKSMTNSTDDYPHTGMMSYDTLVTTAKIPCFAISGKGAAALDKMIAVDKNTEVFLFSDCQTLPDLPSYSVVGEIRGKEIPNEVIVVGGHLDSWDTGEGAHDDGAGVVQSIEILAAFKASGIKNKRTIRSIAFMNEENGLRGGKSYAQYAAKEGKKHIAAMESDGGGLVPRSVGVNVSGDTLRYYEKWSSLLEPYAVSINGHGGGADIGPLQKSGTTQMSLNVDPQRYFDYHHTANDVFENVHKRELELGSAAMNAFIYLLDKYGAYKK
jgi:hypothetical protein